MKKFVVCLLAICFSVVLLAGCGGGGGSAYGAPSVDAPVDPADPSNIPVADARQPEKDVSQVSVGSGVDGGTDVSGDGLSDPADDPILALGPVGPADSGDPDGSDPSVTDEPQEEPYVSADPVNPVEPVVSTGGDAPSPVWYEDNLVEYLESAAGWSGRSYMVSPASFRAALCLVIEGAAGDTKSGLLEAAMFGTEQAAGNWYARFLSCRDEFVEASERMKAEAELYGGEAPDMAFDIANAVWSNSTLSSGFSPGYTASVLEKYHAAAMASPADKITGDVNGWCSEQTHGMIPSIASDLSEVQAVLANALYIKSAWTSSFSDSMTAPGDFTKADGSAVTLDFMEQTDDFLYYEEAGGRKYAAFGLYGDIWLTVCLDPDARVLDLYGSMYHASRETLRVRMPKLDMETSFDRQELVDYLKACGAEAAVTGLADFSVMIDSDEMDWHIGDVVQKTRLKMDEDGMEAAAVTAVMMVTDAISIMPPEPIEFDMDSPFTFMISKGLYQQERGCEVLFFGRYAGE